LRYQFDKTAFVIQSDLMRRRTILYISGQPCSAGTSSELFDCLKRAVEERGDVVVATFSDHDAQGRRKTGWNALLANLDAVDQVAVASAADLPGKTVNDLLRLLRTLRDRDVDLFLLTEGIDTASGSAAVLDLVSAFRSAKLSAAIRRGQDRARAAGKIIGRPAIPPVTLACIQACLRQGGGVRPTAKKFGVSPASVATAKKLMIANSDKMAA
jgi:DNA invertase Pin-like site-specific DNA recombinase